MVTCFRQTATLKRPLERSSYDAVQSYSTCELYRIKVAQPTKGWTVSTSGAVQSVTATLYYNVGISNAINALEPLFKAGDIVVMPDATKYVVQGVTTQMQKGSLHHYEVVLT